MQGSFTPDSAEKFLALMRDAGYETSALADTGKFQNFSEGVRSRGEQQFVANSGEARGEYIENYDYTRCVRPDGTAYGTGGTCRKGTPEEKDENDAMSQLAGMLPKGSKIVGSSGRTQTVGAKGKVKAGLTGEHWAVINEKAKEVGDKLSRQKGLLSRMSDSPKFDDLRKATQEKIEKLSGTYKKLNQTKMQIRDSLDKGRIETGVMVPLVPNNLTPSGVTKFPSKARVSQTADPTPSKGATSDKKKRGPKPGGMRVTEKIKALGAKDLEKVLSDPRLNDRQREQLNKLLAEKESATAKQAKDPAPKRDLRGQELANAMVLHANIAERVRANYGGSLATKKARAELQEALDKEGALNSEEISRMLKAQRAEREGGEKTRTASGTTSVDLNPKEVFDPFSSRVKALKVNRDEEIRRPDGLLIADSPRNGRIKVVQELYERLPNSRSEGETKFLKESIEKALSSLEGE